MPGVIFIVCIPTSNYEHILKYGKPKELISLEESDMKKCKLEVELRNKKAKSIPIHLTQHHYNDVYYNHKLEKIREDDELITMENILHELLRKLDVEHVVWISDEMGNYFEVIFPLSTGDKCETMLHCLTQLGIGVCCKSIVSVLPCNVVHSAIEIAKDDDSILSLAALGLVENNASNIVAAMLVSPLMGPVMSITFGTIIADRSLVKSGFESLIIGMLASLLFGFIFGLILGTTEMPWGYGDWPTEEMKARGNVRSLWMGVLWALTSGTGVALALLQGSAGPLIGIAISASLLPPVVNCGLYWALACIWLLYPGTKIPHLKGEPYYGNSSYEPLYHNYLPIEFAVNGIVSCCLTIVNVICIFITAIMFLKIKEVAAPYTSTPDLRRFWEQDIKVAREANKSNAKSDDDTAELVMGEMNQAEDDEMKEKLEAAVQEALDDETYRKVKRMSYQSHTADEVIRTIGLQPRTPTSVRSSVVSGGISPKLPQPQRGSNINDIATLDKLLTSLLGLQKRRSYRSHIGTPRASHLPTLQETGLNRRSESWPDKIYEDSIVRNVLNNLKSKRNSPNDEGFLTPN
ncbi:uncharacterized protein LOC123694353 isoform X3 [Colias croceus]|uniref:uncharacterized protein LOC123694353 isoform X3 n=1 Tax=Colias crocea TaxID=72248 RepID=UPI001E2809EF|nr:uncharacterized protein LOC123694353 isoform X3 [Colias croceus]